MLRSILLLEDDISLGDTLQKRLKKEGFKVLWCDCIASARLEYQTFKPDLAVLDIGLPDGSGLDLGRELKQAGVPVVYLTAMNSPEFRLEAFELGADDYIPKPFHLKELLLRLSRLLGEYTLPKIVRTKELVIDLESLTVKILGSSFSPQLTAREVQLLAFLAWRSPKVLSRAEILEMWQTSTSGNARTIDNAVLKIRHELNCLDRNPIESIRGKGYRWIP